MKRLLILGGGTAGTMVANKLRPRLHADDWSITVVDQDDVHLYQPGYLFIPFGIYEPDDVVKPREQFIPEGVELVIGAVDKVVPDDNSVLLTDGRTLDYDQLVIASGTTPRPDQTPGMDGEEFGKSIHEFYSLAGSTALAHTLKTWEGGRLVVHIVDMPIKCPVAPLEFTFLADAFFAEHGMRDQVEITYVTPLPGAFTKPIASKYLGGMLDERKIALESDFMVERIDEETKTLVSYDEREVPFDLLVSIPLHAGAAFVSRSPGLGDDLGFVKTHPNTLQAERAANIFAIGDATNVPASKAGSVAHFESEVLIENVKHFLAGEPLEPGFDGHANCFIETGHDKALLIDFNYQVEPLHGKFPVPWLGPMTLMEESRVNHLGKMAFKWVYWNVLLPGRDIPMVGPRMSMSGKIRPEPAATAA